MLNFIIPVRARAASKNWSLLEELLSRTLLSLVGQTDPRWRAIIVCHDKPAAIDKLSDKLVCLQVKTEVPTNSSEMMDDKRGKTSIGIRYAAEMANQESWICILDPDDLVHKDVTKFVHDSPSSGGWYVSHGYAARRRPKIMLSLSSYENVCGSSFFLRFNPWLKSSSDLECFVNLVNRGHHLRRELFDQSGLPLQAIPFFAGVYTVETGENWSGSFIALRGGYRRMIRQIKDYRFVNKDIIEDFPGIMR